MLKWLRTGNPYTLFYVLIYALVVNFYYLLHPLSPLLASLSDGLLYDALVRWLQNTVGLGDQGFSVLTFSLLFVEAILLNTQVNRYKILPGASYFTAFCFILFSCFFPEWHAFSAPLIAGLPFLGFIRLLFTLYENDHPRTTVFNLGLLAGLAGLFYLPALVLILVIWFALLVERPFKAPEWLLAILGMICPWYFLAAYLFLTNQFYLFKEMPLPGFSFPVVSYASGTMGGLIILLAYFLYGSIQLQRIYSTLFIHVRKSWTVLLALLILGLALPFIPDAFYTNGWLLAFFPMSIIIGCGFWHTEKKWPALILHIIALAFIFFQQWIK